MAAQDDRTTLTQFATPPSEPKSSQSFLSRLLNRDKRKVSENAVSEAITYNPTRRNKVSFIVPGINGEEREPYVADGSAESLTPAGKRRLVKPELRTVPNVLGRLSSILERKSSSSELFRPYKDSEFRQSWMPDSSCKECYDCGSKFTTFIRRHHCRICGQIFCSSCCNQEVPGRIMGFEGGLRACTYCCQVVTGLMEGSDSGDLGTLRDNLNAQLSNSSTSSVDLRTSGSHGSFTPRRLSVSDSFIHSFESPSSRITSVFDVPPTPEPMHDMTLEERQSLVKDSMQLKDLFFEMLDPVDGVQLTSKRHRLRTYPDCFHGIELKDWLVDHDKAQDMPQAVVIGQALLDASYVQWLTDPNRSAFFNDYTLYQFRPLSHSEVQSGHVRRLSLYPENAEDAPGWVQELDHNELNPEMSADFGHLLMRSVASNVTSNEERERSRSHMLEATYDSDSKTNLTPTMISSTNHRPVPYKKFTGLTSAGSSEQISTKEDIHGYVGMPLHVTETELCAAAQQAVDDQLTIIQDQFKLTYNEHIRRLCTQLLERRKIPLTWANILMTLGTSVSRFVRADVCANQDQMDITSYVHIKKVRSGDPSSSDVTYGVVCTKSVIHNRMKTSIRGPHIMLLQSSIEYQRVTNKLSSLDPQILQEQEYLQNCVSKICKYKPNVLLVEGTVSRVAQQLLLDAGITVVINVKTSVMRRIARMTMGDVIPSIDSLISPPQLGTCYRFQTDLYRFHDGYYKTLMVFGGCPANLGCTVMLRGSNYAELVKVKPILLLIIQACYQAKLEISFLNDLSALPPSEKLRKGRARHASAESNYSLDSVLISKSTDSVKTHETLSASSSSASTAQQHQGANDPSLFQHVFTNSVLDFSPFIKVSPPYFETERGRISSTKLGLVAPSYISPLLTVSGDGEVRSDNKTRGSNELYEHRMQTDCIESLTAELKDEHELVTTGINCLLDSKRLKDLRASYMGSGGRLVVKSEMFHDDIYKESNNEQISRPGPDCFDISFHQRMSVLFSSCTVDSSLHSCVKPWIVPMRFYGKNDITLGQFLEVYCFLPTYLCPREDCEVPMLEHIRKFVHGTGSLYLIVRRITRPEESQSDDKVITTWSWCRKCKKATAVVPMAPSSWHLSFARYLRLRLNCTLTGSQVSEDCVHSLSKDYYQYFRFNDLVATFRYSSVTLREVLFPPASVSVKHSISKKDVNSQVGIIHTHGMGLFSEVLETIYKLESLGLDSEGKKQLISQAKQDLEKEKGWFTDEIYRIQTKLLEEPLPSGAELSNFRASTNKEYVVLYQLEDDIIKLKCYLAKAVQQWNIRLELVGTKDDREKLLRNETGLYGKSPKLADPTSASSADIFEAAPVSSKDPEGPVQSAADEQIVDTEDIHDGSSSDSDNEAKMLVASDGQVLAHYHNSISHGLRAGVQRAATVASIAGSLDSSFVLCGTPDSSSPGKLTVGDKEQLQDPSCVKVTAEVHCSGATATPDSTHWEQSPIKHKQSPIKHKQSTTPVEISTNDSSLPAHSQTPSDTELLKSGSTVPDGAQSVRSSAAMYMPASEEHDPFLLGSPAGTHNTDLVDQSDANSNHFNDKEFLEENDNVDELLSSAAKEKKNSIGQLRRNISTNDALLTISSHRNNKKAKMLKKSSSKAFIESVKSMLPASEEVILPIENPFSDNEHYLLHPTVNVPVIIYDEEPSSIIAYALGSNTYEDMLLEQQKQETVGPTGNADSSLPEEADRDSSNIELVLKLTSVSSLAASLKSFQKSNSAVSLVSSAPDSLDSRDWSDLSSNSAQQSGDVDPYRFGRPKEFIEAVPNSNQHFEMQFTEKSVADDKMSLFYCKVYFAAEFKRLRQLVYSEGENHFIRSISRCYKWNAKGGKSGLGFCKTKDERFIIKQMGRQEIQSFMDFGPYYFEYLNRSLQSSDTSKGKCALAKIFGVFRIGLKNFVTNAVFKQDVLVIENLFYGHRVGKVFDLKGSDRNRLAKKETILDAVLLDENFMKYSKQNPIYVREHAKRLLMKTLTCDSQFLSKHTVMDYSLLCAYDEDSKELVIGIIDYIRTFTWDKKLETVVKSSGILGGQGKMPTIVSPEVYRTRFLEAMERYLNVVPDRWRDFAAYSQ